jgi:hypothetical protein
MEPPKQGAVSHYLGELAHIPLFDMSNNSCSGVGVFADFAGDRVLKEGLGDGTLEALIHLSHHQISLTIHLCVLLI